MVGVQGWVRVRDWVEPDEAAAWSGDWLVQWCGADPVAGGADKRELVARMWTRRKAQRKPKRRTVITAELWREEGGDREVLLFLEGPATPRRL
ncbi:hypothetical protein Ade02nite_73260 [Paractinoplanes deccanensis]|uniref:Uncharacterized protein n=1 Tax=Paractinoplanes deccanensis TaxID=113561 RepID=A0ABQ3YFK8_9ACTN|nr:hypothetical protein [Actinoplanes deccanensis]GID78685.1 hypothetical protein Ade02nite_73260 [Actinoplanes deccanensis]